MLLWWSYDFNSHSVRYWRREKKHACCSEMSIMHSALITTPFLPPKWPWRSLTFQAASCLCILKEIHWHCLAWTCSTRTLGNRSVSSCGPSQLLLHWGLQCPCLSNIKWTCVVNERLAMLKNHQDNLMMGWLTDARHILPTGQDHCQNRGDNVNA